MREPRGNNWSHLCAFILVSKSSLIMKPNIVRSIQEKLSTYKLLFRWINPLLIKGYKFDLNIQDIFRPLEKDYATLRADMLNE